MNFETWLYYFLAVLVLTASPGPSVLLCVTKAVTHGFRASVFTALGSLTAIVGVMTLSFTGLGVVLASSEMIFNAIKWAGAAYLIYLGYKAFTSKETSYELADDKSSAAKKSALSLYMSGFIVGASNPKAIVFFTALFPQFIDMQEPLLFQYVIFAVTFTFMELSWLMIYAYLGSRSSKWLLKDGRAKLFNRITGGVLMSSGVALSVSSRS
ncbi:MAG: flagellar biosynthesis protein FlgM [Rhodospirillaceae bacterium]|nr:MAG: flagellar biosynthesis protein FlgM [Rhodospirillaceae bacterium]